MLCVGIAQPCFGFPDEGIGDCDLRQPDDPALYRSGPRPRGGALHDYVVEVPLRFERHGLTRGIFETIDARLAERREGLRVHIRVRGEPPSA